ncbi:hypothetical protein F7725_009589 [Dissostichus mawsoni]|uniref:RING-type domain-containing protein n=1 Tax=Dissostichus mawsoni TaxID=36200 RepID=A0A7J5XLI1_DISMA|nr:hypothetical protein F7725_009589 [Dissostichus mawsoni]
MEDGSLTSEDISNYQHCDWSVWPRDVLQCLECVVCLENFVSEELLMALPCGHVFHQQCIVVWLASGRHCCPSKQAHFVVTESQDNCKNYILCYD